LEVRNVRWGLAEVDALGNGEIAHTFWIQKHALEPGGVLSVWHISLLCGPRCEDKVAHARDVDEGASTVVDGCVANKAIFHGHDGVGDGAKDLILRAHFVCVCIENLNLLGIAGSREGNCRQKSRDFVLLGINVKTHLFVLGLGSVELALVERVRLENQLRIDPAVERQLWGREIVKMQSVQGNVYHFADTLIFVQNRHILYHDPS